MDRCVNVSICGRTGAEIYPVPTHLMGSVLNSDLLPTALTAAAQTLSKRLTITKLQRSAVDLRERGGTLWTTRKALSGE